MLPKAWTAEIGFSTEMQGRSVTIAAGYQATEEALALGLPETRILGAISMGIFDNTTLSLEYSVEEDYETEDGGTGEDAEWAKLQLAVEF